MRPEEQDYGGTWLSTDSADPGLPSDPIPIDADHDTICRPSDREAEVYLCVRAFLNSVSRRHREDLVANAIERNSERISEIAIAQFDHYGVTQGKLDRIIAALPQAGGNEVIDAEVEKRLWEIRKARFLFGYDHHSRTCQLYDSLTSGDLSNASSLIKMRAFAWCARLSEIPNEKSIYDDAIRAACLLGECDEIRIAKAFRTSREDRSTALSEFQRIGTPASSSASFIIVGREESPEITLSWFKQTGLEISDLDPDGKFYLIQKCFQAQRWNEAFNYAKRLRPK